MAIGFNNDVNNLGILNGTVGTDYRNLISTVQGDLRRVASPTNDASTTSGTINSSGIGISYTPKRNNSLVKLTFMFGHVSSWATGATSYEYSFTTYYRDTVSVPNMGSSIPVTSTSLVSNAILPMGVGYQNSGFWFGISNTTAVIFDTPNTTNTIYYYIGYRTNSSNGTFTIYSNSSTPYISKYLIEEYV